MSEKLKEEWRALGFHQLQAKKLADLGIKPSEAEGLTFEEVEAKWPQFSVKLQERIYDVLGAVIDDEEVVDEEVIEEGADEPEEVEEEPEPEPEPEPKPKPKPKKKAEKEEVKDKTPKPKTKKGKALLENFQRLANVKTLPVEEKRKLLLSKCKPEQEAGFIGFADTLKSLEYDFLPTGFTALDDELGGGWPIGKHSSIYGEEQTCKTTLCIHTIAYDMALNPDSIWVWVNSEASFDIKWATRLGIDPHRLYVLEPDIFETQVDQMCELVSTGAVTGIVVDSVGGSVPWQEVKKKADDGSFTKDTAAETMALLARSLGKVLRRLTILIAQHKVAVIWISHGYQAIGPQAQYLPLQVKGGNAFKHFSHVRIRTSRRKGDRTAKQKILMSDGREKDVFAAYEAGFTIDKTRQSATETHQVFIPFVFGIGLSNMESVIEMAMAHGVFHVNGTYYWHESFGSDQSAWIQGREKMYDHVRNNPDIFEQILTEVGVLLSAKKMEESSAALD